jgi:hypothetical protein
LLNLLLAQVTFLLVEDVPLPDTYGSTYQSLCLRLYSLDAGLRQTLCYILQTLPEVC